MYQHAVLSRILWPLLIYEVPISTVDTLERKSTGFLRRWFGLPRSQSSAALYGSTCTLRLPISGLSEEFKVTKTREALMYRESKDPKVVAANIEVCTGRKWSAAQEIRIAEEKMRHKDILGTVAIGRTGLGYLTNPQNEGGSKRLWIQVEVRAGVEESRLCKMVGFNQQRAWTK